MELLGAVSMGYRNRDNLLLGDEETADRELLEFKMRGGKSVVEVTSIGLGRDPQALRRAANASGLHVIAGSGWYREDFYPAGLAERSVESLADEIVRDLSVGMGDTGIRAGIIGALYIGSDSPSAAEVKVLQAAARASRRTGAAVSLSFPDRAGLSARKSAFAALQAAGVDPKRVVLGRSDLLVRDPGAIKGLLEMGTHVQFDGLGEYSPLLRRPVTDHHVAEAIVELVKAGIGDRLLLSQAVDSKIALRCFGGRGYAYVVELFVPHLRKLGLTGEQIAVMIEKNPQRLLTLAAPTGR
jgi:phosphotriesterase-related protein